MNLDGATISKIFLGQITNWNDPAIAALNKGANLPNLKITPVFRSDGSGTSYNFTDYLSSVNAHVEDEDRHLDAAGVPGRVRARRARAASQAWSAGHTGAIGYVDVAYAIDEPPQVRGGAERGREVPVSEPPARSQAAALAFTKVPANNEMHIVNPPKSAALAYPISTYTYVIVHKSTPHARRAAEDDLLGADPGPADAVRGEADLRAAVDRQAGARRGGEDAQADPGASSRRN